MLLKVTRKGEEFPKHLKFGFPEGFSSVCLFCCLETDLNKRLHVDRVFSGRGSVMAKGCLIDMSRNIKHAWSECPTVTPSRWQVSCERGLSVSALV